MALFANGGRFTSKPYVASGAYVKRMSNYCTGCQYEPETRVGAKACPMTTLYWNFLDQHEAAFADNPRTALMVKNLQRMTPELRSEVRARERNAGGAGLFVIAASALFTKTGTNSIWLFKKIGQSLLILQKIQTIVIGSRYQCCIAIEFEGLPEFCSDQAVTARQNKKTQESQHVRTSPPPSQKAA